MKEQNTSSIPMEISEASLEAIPAYSDVFHPPLRQHFYYYCYNRQHDYQTAVEKAKANYLPLNEANLQLGRFCKRCILDMINYPDASPGQNIPILQDTLDKWQQVYIAGNVFNTFKFANHIISGLRQVGYPFAEKLEKEIVLRQSFIQVPPPIKVFFQLALVVSDKFLFGFLEQLIAMFREDSSLAYYVGELHISEKSTQFKVPDGKESHWTVKINLLPEVVNSRKNPIIKELLAAILPLLRDHHPVDLQLNPFSVHVGKNIYLSQGNSSYKRFLELLGVLDEVYQARGNYAYYAG